MRWISAILAFSLVCSFAHEAACHEGAGRAEFTWSSHSGPQHDHDSDADHRHNSEETGQDSDHHDADTHDHLSDIVLVKKDPSTDLRVLSNPVPATASQISASPDLGVEPFSLYTGTYVSESSLPAYVRAHVLLL
jgi:hypothetical protein